MKLCEICGIYEQRDPHFLTPDEARLQTQYGACRYCIDRYLAAVRTQHAWNYVDWQPADKAPQ